MGILLKQPAVSINAHDVGWPSYNMWRTIDAPEGTTAGTAAGWIFAANMEAMKTWKTPLRNIVLNAHGYPGKVSIGGMKRDHIYTTDLSVFGILRPLNIGTIWLCGLEGGRGTDWVKFLFSARRDCRHGSHRFRHTPGGHPVPRDQSDLLGGGNEIDDFKGTVYSFTPSARRTIINPTNRDVATVGSSRRLSPISCYSTGSRGDNFCKEPDQVGHGFAAAVISRR